MKNVGVLFAMKEEFLPVSGTLGEPVRSEGTEGFPVRVYRLEGKTVYAVVSGVGQIRAAAATQLLITKYNAECVLNFGLAGGLTDKIKTMDIVLVDTVVQADFDISAGCNYAKGQLPGFGGPYIKTDRKLLEKAWRAGDFELVTCASADRFVDTRADREALVKQFGAQICEMEAAGVQITAMLNNVPALFVKAVSDSIDGGVAEFNAVMGKAVIVYRNLFGKLIGEL